MKRILASVLILLCTASITFAAPKKKKKSPPVKKEPEIVFDDSCYSNAISYQTLMTTNPYDTVGKCYWMGFPLVKQQLLARNVALVGFVSSQQNIFAFMHFGDESVPVMPFYGLVMGAGAYEYETVGGSMNTVHRLIKMKEYLKDPRKPKPEKEKEKEKAPVLTNYSSVPSKLTFKKGTSFTHSTHSGLDCIKCHAGTPGKISNFGKDYAHATCKGCHANSRGPTSCKECHK